MDNVFCSGSESQLTDCSYSDTHNCAHSEDASVICLEVPGECYTSNGYNSILYQPTVAKEK